jgi:MFS family permease
MPASCVRFSRLWALTCASVPNDVTRPSVRSGSAHDHWPWQRREANGGATLCARQTGALVTPAREAQAPGPRGSWLTPGVRGIGAASLLADAGHEVPTALLPSLLTSTLGAPASALGLIEGVSDGLAGAARLGGGALADDPHRRRAAAVGGYTTTAVLSGLIGAATSAWQVGVLRAGAWAARGLRVPSRNALLADVVPADAYGRAYGFERAMDNLGAIIGPLLAIALVAMVGVRTAILLSIVPGLLAVAAILYAIHHIAQPAERERRPLRLHVRPVLQGRLGRLLAGVSVFELGNVAATLLILRATDLLEPGRGQDAAVRGSAFGVRPVCRASAISPPALSPGSSTRSPRRPPRSRLLPR